MIRPSLTGSLMVLATCGTRNPPSLLSTSLHPVASLSQASQVSHTGDWKAVTDDSLAETSNSIVVAQGGNSTTLSGVQTVTLTSNAEVTWIPQTSSYVLNPVSILSCMSLHDDTGPL